VALLEGKAAQFALPAPKSHPQQPAVAPRQMPAEVPPPASPLPKPSAPQEMQSKAEAPPGEGVGPEPAEGELSAVPAAEPAAKESTAAVSVPPPAAAEQEGVLAPTRATTAERASPLAAHRDEGRTQETPSASEKRTAGGSAGMPIPETDAGGADERGVHETGLTHEVPLLTVCSMYLDLHPTDHKAKLNLRAPTVPFSVYTLYILVFMEAITHLLMRVLHCFVCLDVEAGFEKVTTTSSCSAKSEHPMAVHPSATCTSCHAANSYLYFFLFPLLEAMAMPA